MTPTVVTGTRAPDGGTRSQRVPGVAGQTGPAAAARGFSLPAGVMESRKVWHAPAVVLEGCR